MLTLGDNFRQLNMILATIFRLSPIWGVDISKNLLILNKNGNTNSNCHASHVYAKGRGT